MSGKGLSRIEIFLQDPAYIDPEFWIPSSVMHNASMIVVTDTEGHRKWIKSRLSGPKDIEERKRVLRQEIKEFFDRVPDGPDHFEVAEALLEHFGVTA